MQLKGSLQLTSVFPHFNEDKLINAFITTIHGRQRDRKISYESSQ